MWNIWWRILNSCVVRNLLPKTWSSLVPWNEQINSFLFCTHFHLFLDCLAWSFFVFAKLTDADINLAFPVHFAEITRVCKAWHGASGSFLEAIWIFLCLSQFVAIHCGETKHSAMEKLSPTHLLFLKHLFPTLSQTASMQNMSIVEISWKRWWFSRINTWMDSELTNFHDCFWASKSKRPPCTHTIQCCPTTPWMCSKCHCWCFCGHTQLSASFEPAGLKMDFVAMFEHPAQPFSRFNKSPTLCIHSLFSITLYYAFSLNFGPLTYTISGACAAVPLSEQMLAG